MNDPNAAETLDELLGEKKSQTGALNVLQFSRVGVEYDPEAVRKAATEVVSYHAVHPGQLQRLTRVADAAATLLVHIVETCPPGPERSTAISRLREAKMWASAAISLEGP